MGITIRRAIAAEFRAVAEVDGANFGFHYSAEELADAARYLLHGGLLADRLPLAGTHI